jgi:hypothetical protein
MSQRSAERRWGYWAQPSQTFAMLLRQGLQRPQPVQEELLVNLTKKNCTAYQAAMTTLPSCQCAW